MRHFESERKDYSKIISERVLGLASVHAAKIIFVYIPYGEEVQTHDLIESLLYQSKTIAEPKVIAKDTIKPILFRGWDELEPAVGNLGTQYLISI